MQCKWVWGAMCVVDVHLKIKVSIRKAFMESRREILSCAHNDTARKREKTYFFYWPQTSKVLKSALLSCKNKCHLVWYLMQWLSNYDISREISCIVPYTVVLFKACSTVCLTICKTVLEGCKKEGKKSRGGKVSILTCWSAVAWRSNHAGIYWASSGFWTHRKSSARTPARDGIVRAKYFYI